MPKIYLHEIGHSVDGRGRSRISSGEAWGRAWHAEAEAAQAMQLEVPSRREWFAQFAVIAWTMPDAARQTFPRSWAVFAAHGLV